MKNEQRPPEHVGPYEVLEVLSRGGMGQVYRARHRTTKQEVVLKVPLEQGHLTHALEREGDVLEGLRHPNIVGVRERGPGWLALELVSGERLARSRRGGNEEQDALLTRLRPFAQLCHALAYLHGMGWVHADLSPSNLLIDEAGHLTLLDFGLATRFGHRLGSEDLERAAMMAGTLAYMSPEGLQGASLDARSDLYALGCLMYEQLSGIPPFRGTRQEVTQGHLTRKPDRLPRSLPTPLVRLVSRLLAKEPGRRPGHAFAVLRALEACGIDAKTQADPPRAYLTPPRLLGREEGMSEWERALTQPTPQSWALVGGPGTGKSRVAFEMIRRARSAGLEVVLMPSETDQPGLLGVFSSSVPTDTVPLDALKRAEAVRVSLTSSQKRLLVFENAEHLSSASVAILEHILRHDSPWVLVCSRVEVESRDFEHVWSMDELDGSQMCALLQDALGGLKAPETLDDFVESRARGNPWLALEYVRAAIDEGVLTFCEDGTYRFDVPQGTLHAELEQVSIPDTVSAMINEQIATFPGPQRSMCLLLAVAGRPLERAFFPDAQALDVLLAIGLVRTHQNMVEWSNPSTGDAVLGAALGPERAQWHLRMLERDDLSDAEQGRHSSALGEHERASVAYERASLSALERSDLNAARVHGLRARSLTEDFERRFDLTEHLISEALLPNVRFKEALELLEEMWPDLPRGLRARWYLLRARSLAAEHDIAGGFDALAECVALMDPSDLLLAATADKVRGLLYYFSDANDEALIAYERAIVSFRALGETRLLADTLMNVAIVLHDREEFVEALRCGQEGADLHASQGNEQSMTLALLIKGVTLRYSGRFEQAIDIIERIEAHHHRFGSYARESIVEIAKAICWYRMGRLCDASALFQELANRRMPYCTPPTYFSAHFWLASIASTRGDLALARKHMDIFEAFYEVEKNARDTHHVPFFEALLEALSGSCDSALNMLDEAIRACPAEPSIMIRQVISRITVLVLYLCGAEERVLEHARREVEGRSSGMMPHMGMLWAWLVVRVKFSRGELESKELEDLLSLRGRDRVMDARIALLSARVALEQGEVTRSRELLDWAHEVCEQEGLRLELMTSWRLESMVAERENEDVSYALEELEVLRANAPPGLPERAWWSPGPE